MALTIAAATLLPPLRPRAAIWGKGLSASACFDSAAPTNPTGTPITPPTSSQANRTTGGNLNLKPEKADTYTIGMVYQPEFVPGLSLAIDWFDIKVNEAVSVPTPGDAIAACFGTNPASPPV